MTCLGASAGQPWSSSQSKSHRLGLTTASASCRQARWAISSPKRATVSGTFCAAAAKTLAGPWQYTTNAVRGKDLPTCRDRSAAYASARQSSAMTTSGGSLCRAAWTCQAGARKDGRTEAPAVRGRTRTFAAE